MARNPIPPQPHFSDTDQLLKNPSNFIKNKKRSTVEVRNKIRATLLSEGWKIMEQDVKYRLRDNYKSLLRVKPENVEKAQNEIKSALDFMENIYNKAGWQWEYDGYSEIKEPVIADGDKAKEEQLYEAYLKKIMEDEDG